MNRAAVLAFVTHTYCFAQCDVFPPGYGPDATEYEMEVAKQAMEQWTASGCDKTMTARQARFQRTYQKCVDSLTRPVTAVETIPLDGDSTLEVAYQAAVRECEANALNSAADADLTASERPLR